MKHTKKLAAALAAGLLFTLAACGDDSGTNDAQATHTASNGDVFNDADVDFASAMIPHHAQAMAMADLTRARDLSPEVRELTEGIQAAQGPEIEQLTDWLTDWDKPVPETMRDDHAEDSGGMSGHDMDGMDDEVDPDMPGMMTNEEMADLEAASGQEFEDMWLEMMIRHHEGAIEMATDEQEAGAFQPAIDLAESIATSQQAEIVRMQELLAS